MEFETISPRDVDAYLFRKDYVVIDIREPRDYRKRHLKGAICIPYQRLEEGVALLRRQELILYCERGSTSLMAARKLSEKGYHVKSVVGGIQAYSGKNVESYSTGRRRE